MAEVRKSNPEKKSSKANAGAEEEHDHDDDHKPIQPAAPKKSKLDFNQMLAFGFHDVEPPKKQGAGGVQEVVREATGGKPGAVRRRSRNATVVYGADSDDDMIDDTADYPQSYYDQYAADADADVSDEDDADADEDVGDVDEEQEEPRKTLHDLANQYDYQEPGADVDEDWEDEDEEEEEVDSEEREELEREAMLEMEMERERYRELRLQEIMKKKELLIERYLKVARVMINLRKKNIYLQDYLYGLAQRKGLLRGDPQPNRPGAASVGGENDPTSLKFIKAQERRERKRHHTMAARFARFLRKTGHFWDPEEAQHRDHVHHHHVRKSRSHRRGRNLRAAGDESAFRNRISRHYNVFKYAGGQGQSHLTPKEQTLLKHKGLPSTAVRKADPKKACVFGKDCKHVSEKQEHRLHARMLRRKEAIRARESLSKIITEQAAQQKRRNSKKPLSLKEILELKAEATMKKLMKGHTNVLEAFEKHRCKMAKKKQQIKIGKLLERAYAGTSLIDPERLHLISFVEQSVTQQNLAKKKALRKKKHQQEKEIKSMGIQHMNHQWFRSLDRIRDLRLKKAKLEQEHRLELMRKVKNWHLWEKRDLTARDAVYDFVVNLSSRVIMDKRETEHFSVGINQFWKQLYTLHDTVLQQLVRVFKARTLLLMAQRRVKDNADVSSQIKGFSMSDYQRMIIENDESHVKLRERQEHLREQHEKLKDYVKKVADSHLRKQRTWGALRAGRHDLKQLFEMCRHERDNLLRKERELQRMQKRHRRFFTQVSVMGNKNCLRDHHKVSVRVQELDDARRKLNTELQQTETIYRVLKVKVTDAQRRIDEAEKERKEKVLKDDMDFYRNTMMQRITPKIPGTVYDANMLSRRSMEKLYGRGERDRETCGYYFVAGASSPKNPTKKFPPLNKK